MGFISREFNNRYRNALTYTRLVNLSGLDKLMTLFEVYRDLSLMRSLS